jgi:hypothetical protein
VRKQTCSLLKLANDKYCIRIEVTTAVAIKNAVFWDT